MRNQEWDSSFAQLYSLDLAQLVLRLFSSDAMDSKPALSIVDEPEILSGFLDRYHVHKTGGERSVSSDLAVDFDEALHDDGLGFARVEGILETVDDTVLDIAAPELLVARLTGLPVANEDN